MVFKLIIKNIPGKQPSWSDLNKGNQTSENKTIDKE